MWAASKSISAKPGRVGKLNAARPTADDVNLDDLGDGLQDRLEIERNTVDRLQWPHFALTGHRLAEQLTSAGMLVAPIHQVGDEELWNCRPAFVGHKTSNSRSRA